MKNELSITISGSPGSGKSTTAALIFYHLKMAGFDIDWKDDSPLIEGERLILKMNSLLSEKTAKKIKIDTKATK